MHVAEIELYEILKSKLGEKEAKTFNQAILSLLEIKIEKTRADIIKWMFLFWIGQMVSLVAILQLFFKK